MDLCINSHLMAFLQKLVDSQPTVDRDVNWVLTKYQWSSNEGIKWHMTAHAFSTSDPIFFGRVELLFVDIEKRKFYKFTHLFGMDNKMQNYKRLEPWC